ncbi:MAG: tRNA (guanosine(46)-N7)-methyltransferase TrmB [Cryomorphaceae bacterium]|nr:tRNA (guanosine(46)-N7)-methyltransferase TrmB [Cryomorphaceae bacterium]
MARKKLSRFEENRSFPHVIEPTRAQVVDGLNLRGNWRKDHFKKDVPLVVELGCGKGEYTVALAEKYPETCFVGVDIKGARIWYGAKDIADKDFQNAAFLRTEIELIDGCFGPEEVDEIWITFPDPQIKHRRSKHRLTHPVLLEKYADILKPNGVLHLKTDSEFLHGYTLGVLHNHPRFSVESAYFDIDHQLTIKDDLLHSVQTHYEMMFREKGKSITYLKAIRKK